MCGKFQGPPANGGSLDRFLNGPFVKTGCCKTAQNGPILKIFDQNYLKFMILILIILIRVGEIFLCLISINSPARFARRGIISSFSELELCFCARFI